MASWFSRRRAPVVVPRLKPRGEQAPSTRVDLGELTPELLPYLGFSARLQLLAFESLSSIVSGVSDLAVKAAVSEAAGAALVRHQGLAAEIRRRDDDPVEVMRPFAEPVERYGRVIRGEGWTEALLGAYVGFGLLDDFFIRLAEGLPGDFGPRAARLLALDSGEEAIAEVLRQAIAEDEPLASVLAMWGRRLVGDTLLLARSVLHHTGDHAEHEENIEPVLTELIAAHTRRMDALGLTA
ncbi:ferritin-like fold-containing protein [Microbacterium sp. STN6]|uniref:ferritin-like fold-containing protein n=1 Tax=Microbacterium sp. STN6 TaxID=2995588 RepID=UPI002260EB5A|nr:ferritin-like fold-containing protein [Microbacterium sp. STN6]MCX7521942.1 ferritin-like fold-containing protein [Microbacterium sp. STN6]